MAIRYTAGNNQGFTPLPEGSYNLVVKTEEDTVSKSGNPQHKIVFEVVDGPHAGRSLFAWYSLLPSASWRFEKLIEATGAEPTVVGQDTDGRDILELGDDALVGCYVTADVTQEEYAGRTNNRVGNEQACNDYAGPYDEAEPEAEAAPVKEKAPTPAPHAGRRRARRSV